MTTRPAEGDQAATPRRGRPRRTPSTSALDPREEILREAARLFSEKGVAGTRMTDIANAVGVRTPAVYYHFDNMGAIVEALLSYVVDESAAFATAATASDGSCSDRLRALVLQHVTRLLGGPYDLWFVVGPSQASSNDFPRIARQVARWRRSVARLVDEGIAAGEFRPIDAGLAVHAVSGLVYAALQARHDGIAVDPAQISDLSVSCLQSPDTSTPAKGTTRARS